MDSELTKRNIARKRRALRIRKNLKGEALKPRLSIFKSNLHLYAQLINDQEHKTLFSLSTLSKQMKEVKLSKKSKKAAQHLGKLLAEEAIKKDYKAVVFDRGRFKYHGIIATFAQAAREAGLQF